MTTPEKLAQKAKLTARLDALDAEVEELDTEAAKLRAEMLASLDEAFDPHTPAPQPQTEKLVALWARKSALVDELTEITNEVEIIFDVVPPPAPRSTP